MANLVCTELFTNRNIYGGYDCKVWTQLEDKKSVFDTLAITYEQYGVIGTEILETFMMFLLFAMLARVINSI